MGEIGYLLESRIGPHAEVSFLKSFGGDGFKIAELEDEDIPRLTRPSKTSSAAAGFVRVCGQAGTRS